MDLLPRALLSSTSALHKLDRWLALVLLCGLAGRIRLQGSSAWLAGGDERRRRVGERTSPLPRFVFQRRFQPDAVGEAIDAS